MTPSRPPSFRLPTGLHAPARHGSRTSPSLIALALGSALAVGCGGANTAFTSRFPDNQVADWKPVLGRMAAAPPRELRAASVALTEDNRLYAYDVHHRKHLWSAPSESRLPPMLADDAVITHEGDSVVGRALRTGDQLFAVEDQGRVLNGADGEHGLVVFTLSGGMGPEATSKVVAVKDGTVQWERKLRFAAGVPAVRGDVVLVPWASQYLSALDARSGREVARLRLRDGVVGHAMIGAGEAYVGQYRVYRLTSALLAAQRPAQGLHVASLELPGQPDLLRNAYHSPHLFAPTSAWHRIGLAWAPKPSGTDGAVFADDQVYLVFYRFVIALDPKTLAPRWAHRHPHDIVGSHANGAELVVADVAGGIAALSARTGVQRWHSQTELRPLVATLHVDAGPQAYVSERSPAPLRDQLLELIVDPDDRLVPARLFALQALSSADDSKATASLLALCQDRGLTKPVQKQACDMLPYRSVGQELLLEALDTQTAFLAGTRAPPLAPLAKALARMQEQRAVPLLLAHLQDPHTPAEDLAALIGALEGLADVSAAPAIADFLRMYHADAPDEHSVEALGAAANALVALEGPNASDTLVPITHGAFTPPGVRERVVLALERLQRQLAAQDAGARVASPIASDAESEAGLDEPENGADAPAASKARPPTPSRLTPELVEESLHPVRDALRACLGGDEKPLFSARIVLVAEDGMLKTLSVVPRELQSCIEPLVRSQTLPRTLSTRPERVTYILNR